MIIAIDGTSASGKSTLGLCLAERLGYLYFDTGVMYRTLALAALERGIPDEDEPALTALAEAILIDVRPATVADGRPCTVLLDGRDVSWAIRTAEVDGHVSPVSVYRDVRTALTAQQRRIGLRGNVVMVGRDIGTVVFPEADLKIYLDASLQERARRRHEELILRGETCTLAEVRRSLADRDRIDSGRAVAPLRPAGDAAVIDSTRLTPREVLDRVLTLLGQRPAAMRPASSPGGG